MLEWLRCDALQRMSLLEATKQKWIDALAFALCSGHPSTCARFLAAQSV